MLLGIKFVQPIDGIFLENPAVVADSRDAQSPRRIGGHLVGRQIVAVDKIGLLEAQELGERLA